MKNLTIAVLSILLIASLGAGFFVLQDLVLAKPKYADIYWSEKDRETLNRAYVELGKANEIPFGHYPYDIYRDDEGVRIIFRSYSFLRLRKSVLLDGDILDGCVYVNFDVEMRLEEVFYCG